MISTVIGLGYGDEGKGLTTNYLCLRAHSRYDSIVVRFSGGQQAGHTVVKGKNKHVFSNLGSGTLAGVDTYWSKFCTFDPVGFIREYELLADLDSIMFIDNSSPVTTPYEIMSNQNDELIREHGTCGVGVGTTLEREEQMYSILFHDLFYDEVLRIKLILNEQRFSRKFSQGLADKISLEKFMDAVHKIRELKNIRRVDSMPQRMNTIFEGSQGLLLDQNIGFFPHVTRSNTDVTNILRMGHNPGHLYLVTRAYQTRHGNGPMTNESIPHNIKDNPLETNVNDFYQGKFRKAILDLSILHYGLNRNPEMKSFMNNSTLVITCLDHVKDAWAFTYDGKLHKFDEEMKFVYAISCILKIKNVILSRSDMSENMIELKGDVTNHCYYRKNTKEFEF